MASKVLTIAGEKKSNQTALEKEESKGERSNHDSINQSVDQSGLDRYFSEFDELMQNG
jgi:hypothetical protein